MIRWLLGSVKFELESSFSEKFVNASIKRGIKIFNLKKIGDKVQVQSSSKEYITLTKMAKKRGIQITMVEKKGLPFLIDKYKWRKGIIIGPILFLVVLCFFSSYIWSIDVSGNQNVSEEEIINVMNDLGISGGSLKKRMDIQTLRQEAMIRLKDIAWLSINIKGSHAEILVKEKIKAPDIFQSDKPCDIRASYDGKIERIETYKGTPAVSVGDAVVKGQILISGVVENQSGGSSFVHAEGKVFALTKRSLKETVKLSQEKAVDTGKIRKKYRVKIFGLEIPFGLWYKTDDSYRCEFRKDKLRIGKMDFPVILYQEKWYEQVCGIVNIGYDEALSEATRILGERESADFGGKKILSKYTEDKREDGLCTVFVSYDCLEDIGLEEEIKFDYDHA